MGLFALNREYQRSIDRIWEEFPDHSRAETEPATAATARVGQQPGPNPGNRQETLRPHGTRDAITPDLERQPGLIQNDARAWACFLDSKRKEASA